MIILEGFFEYKKSIENASIKTNNLTTLLSKKLESDFENTNNLLKFAQNIIINIRKENKYFLEANDEDKKEIITKRFTSLINDSKNITSLSYVDSNGNIIYSSTLLNSVINLSDREYFKKLKYNENLIISFSDVITSRTSGKKSLVLARAIRDENEDLLGVIIAQININTINETLASVDLGKDGVSLLRRSDDSKLISRYPANDTVKLNQRLPANNPIIERINSGEKTGTLEYIASTDGKKRLGSFIVMEKFPFYVQTAISEDVYLAQWKDDLKIVAILFVLFIFISFLIFLILNKSFKKEQQAVNELLKNQSLFSSGPVITIEWLPQDNWPIKNISNNCKDILGYTKAEILSKDFNYSNLIHPNDKNKIFREIENFIKNNINSFEQYYRIQLKNGTYKYFYDYTKITRDKNNKIINFIGYILDQTNLREKEESLLIEKNRLANIILGTNAGTWEWNIQTNEVIFNDKWAEMLGFTLEELSPLDINTWINLAHPDDLQKSSELLKKHFNKELDYYDCEIRVKHKNGSWVWIKDRGKVISWDNYGKPIFMMGTHTDITKEKELIHEIEITKNRFENMFKNHTSIMLLINPENGEIIDANQSAVNFYGYNLDELKQMNISKINQATIFELKEKYKQAKNSLKKSFIFSHKLKNGEIKTVEVSSSPIETSHGIILFSIIKDITKEQALENEILKEKIRFQTFINLSSDAIFILDEEGKLLEYSLQTQKYLKYSDEEMKNLNILYVDKDLQDIQEYKDLISRIDGNHTLFFERIHTRKDNSYYNAAISATKISLDGKKYIYSSVRDITDKKMIQNKLQKFYENLEKLIDKQDNIVILTNGKKIKFANHKFFDFLGFENLENFKEHHNCICEFFIENDRFFHLKKINENDNWTIKIMELEESKRIVSIKGKDSEKYVFSVNVNKFDEDNMIISFTNISQTIFENIYLEEKTLHDKLTNAYNREYFDRNYRNLIDEYHKNNTKLALAILDIDHFKRVNDNYGHDVGDEVLIKFVDTIQNNLRKNDILIRWGGEEFLLILQLNSKKDLEKKLEYLKNAIEIELFPKVNKITCSIGGTIYEDDENIMKTIKRADEELYKAKAAGRNKVFIS
uniref:PAS domain S-box protein n=1 Tax=Aliarcobacter sp. TaxID=2321116 RepID=UPI0040473011